MDLRNFLRHYTVLVPCVSHIMIVVNNTHSLQAEFFLFCPFSFAVPKAPPSLGERWLSSTSALRILK